MSHEIYSYVSENTNQLIIGTRGVSEYKVDFREAQAEFLRTGKDRLSPPEQLQAMLKIAIKISQYTEFEQL